MERKLEIEVGQSLVEFEAFSDEGDHQVFTPSAALMSAVVAPVIRADGIVTGINLITVDSSDDTVAVAAFSANSQGTLHAVPAGTLGATRPSTDVAKVISITMSSAGALAAIVGIDGTDANFNEVRGEAGAPPYIPVGSIELGQVRLTASAAGVVTASEIKQNGQYTERADYPVYTINPMGKGMAATDAGTASAFVEFSEVLDTRHTADLAKGVYGQYYTPGFAPLSRVENFNPASNSHSLSSTETFDGPVGEKSTSLGQASFSLLFGDGVNDLVLAQEDKNVLFKFYPNKNATAHWLTQGSLGISSNFEASGKGKASCTITPEVKSIRITG